MKTIEDFNGNPVAKELYKIISNCSGGLTSAIKWSRLTYTVDNDYHYWVCAIALLKGKVKLLFHYGGLLNDPSGLLEAGNNDFLRQMTFKTPLDIQSEVIEDFLDQAIEKRENFKHIWEKSR